MAQMQISIQDVVEEVKQSNPAADTDVIERAYLYAEKMHEGQYRLNGVPYITHPLEIARILAMMQMDISTIIGGLLHDVIEDTPGTYEEINEMFGEDVARLVEGVTKIEHLTYSDTDKQEAQLLTFRKMFVAMADDIRVIIIKLADRLHNMRTLDAMSQEKQMQKSQEVLDIFAPICHRLGFFVMMTEMEDLALRYLRPDVYADLTKKVVQKRAERQEFVNTVISMLRAALEKEGIECEIRGRPKHFYSIYKKMQSGHSFDEIYDLTAVRVIVDTISDCYTVLGHVNGLWKAIQGRLKDYISVPKSNQYQSLHTTVIGPGGLPVEIQIRTKEMHRIAEYGMAAHLKYKEGGKSKDDELSRMLAYLLDVFENEEDLDDNQEYIDAVKKELPPEEVYVFTPKGRAIGLPANATPIDFAYRIHSDIGDKCVGARVNSRMVPLNHMLETGDIVEILTNPNSKGPSRDWLNVAVSAAARNKIRTFFRKSDRTENIAKGKDLLEREILSQNLAISDIVREKYEDFILRRFKVASWEDLYAVIGYGGLRPQFAVTRIRENFRNDFPQEERKPTTIAPPNSPKDRTVEIEGQEGMAFKFAKCCTPVPGDSIIGYVTRGRGVTIHRCDCSNILNSSEPERFLPVNWAEGSSQKEKFVVEIFLKALDRNRLLSDISTVIGNEGISISSISSRTVGDTVQISIDIVVRTSEQVDQLLNKLSSVPSMLAAHRI